MAHEKKKTGLYPGSADINTLPRLTAVQIHGYSSAKYNVNVLLNTSLRSSATGIHGTATSSNIIMQI